MAYNIDSEEDLIKAHDNSLDNRFYALHQPFHHDPEANPYAPLRTARSHSTQTLEPLSAYRNQLKYIS